MAKKPKVEVDESLVKQVIAGTYHYKGHTGNSGTDPIRNRYGRNSRRTALCSGDRHRKDSG